MNSGVSVTIITFNEEDNLPRALQSCKWADEVIIVDSGSTDKTVEIAKNFGAKVFSNPWPGFGQQKNFAQDHATHDWVLNIDADEEIPAPLAHEIMARLKQNATSSSPFFGFAFPRKTFYLGRWIRHGGWYPNHLTRLSRRSKSRWTEPHVHETLQVEGAVGLLKEPLHHYTFTGIEDQIMTNLRYSRHGFRDLLVRGQKQSLLKLLLKPIWKFIETYWIKLGVLDGLPGLIISINAAHSIFLKYAYFFEPHHAKSQKHPDY